jgi:hypothetical protein
MRVSRNVETPGRASPLCFSLSHDCQNNGGGEMIILIILDSCLIKPAFVIPLYPLLYPPCLDLPWKLLLAFCFKAIIPFKALLRCAKRPQPLVFVVND